MTLTGQHRAGQQGARRARRPTPADLVGRPYASLATDAGVDAVSRGAAPRPGGRRRRRSSSSSRSRRHAARAGCWPRPRRCKDARGRPLYLFVQSQDVTSSAARKRICARARTASGCSSRRCRTTRSSCSTRRAWSRAGTPARNGSRATRRRDHRSALPDVLPAGHAGHRAPRARTRTGAGARPLRGGGLAHPQGRQPVLGQRRDHRGPQPDGRAHRIREGHARHRRAAADAARRRRRARRRSGANVLAVTAHELPTRRSSSPSPCFERFGQPPRPDTGPRWPRPSGPTWLGRSRPAPTGCSGCSATCSPQPGWSRGRSSLAGSGWTSRDLLARSLAAGHAAAPERRHRARRARRAVCPRRDRPASPRRSTTWSPTRVRHGAPPVTVQARRERRPRRDRRQRCRRWCVRRRARPAVRALRHRPASVAAPGSGLFIVRELARAHGGDAWYEPAGDGPAAFVLSLPALDA